MDGHVTHGARLVLGCLVVRRPLRALRGERMALQAQKVDLTHPQQTWIRRAMRRVASRASLGFDRHMLVDKWPARIGVALDAGSISAGQGFGLPQRGGAVNVVAVTALNQSFIHAMVIGPGKLRPGRGVA